MDINKLFPDMNDDQARKAFLERVNQEINAAPPAPHTEKEPEEAEDELPDVIEYGPAHLAWMLEQMFGEDADDEEEGFPWEGDQALIGLLEAIRLLHKHLSKKDFDKAMKKLLKRMRME